MKDAKFWRIYYKIQELLVREYIDSYTSGEMYGIREQSTLPPKLNSKAYQLTQQIVDEHTPKDRVRFLTDELYGMIQGLDQAGKHDDATDAISIYLSTMPQDELELKLQEDVDYMISQTSKGAYHMLLDMEMTNDLRAMIDPVVNADCYYIVTNIDTDELLGGFTTSSNGSLGGFFCLKKGFGHELYKKRLETALRDAHDQVTEFSLNCTGDFLASFYIKHGFEIESVHNWDERLAPPNWNTERFGTPKIYFMKKDI